MKSELEAVYRIGITGVIYGYANPNAQNAYEDDKIHEDMRSTLVVRNMEGYNDRVIVEIDTAEGYQGITVDAWTLKELVSRFTRDGGF